MYQAQIEIDRETRLNRFHRSELVQEGWPVWPSHNYSVYERHTVAAQCAHALHIFFTLLHGAELTAEQVKLTHWDLSPLHDLVHTCSIAEYFGSLLAIKPTVDRFFENLPDLWSSVAAEPLRWAMMAKKLHHKDIFEDALRHLIAGAHHFDLHGDPHEDGIPGRDDGFNGFKWPIIADLLEISEGDAKAIFKPQMFEVSSQLAQLEGKLHALSLFETKFFFKHKHLGRSKFLDWLTYRPKDRSDGQKTNERSTYLARTHYQQCLTELLHGNPVIYDR